MAEFGASVTEAPQTPNAITPKEGVVKEPILIAGAANLFGGIREAVAKKKKGEGNAFLSQFSNEQLGIIQAVEQGGMTSQAARTRIRTNLMTAINNYPGIRAELIKANGAILGTAGMGDIVTDGTKEELRRDSLRNAMVNEGLVAPDADEQAFSQAENNFMLAQESKRRFDAEMDTISLIRAKQGVTKAELEIADTREKRAANDFLVGNAPALMDQFKETSNRLINLIGQEGFDEGNVVSLIEQRFNEFEQSLSVPLSRTDSHTSQALMKGFREFKDITVKRAKGEFTQEAFDRQKKQIISQQEMVALGDPMISRAVALSTLGLNDLLLPEKLQISSKAAEFLSGNLDDEEPPANLFTDSVTGKKAAQTYLQMFSVNPNNLSDEQKAEQLQHLTKVMEGVTDYASFIEANPERGIEVVTNWMSTQDFFNLRKEHPEVFENNTTSARILQSNYGDQVWGMIDKEFNKNAIIRVLEPATGGPMSNSTGKVEVTQTPDAVTYEPTSNGMQFVAVNKGDQKAIARAKTLNKDLAPIINKNVKAFAHLAGRNDYGKFWESINQDFMTGGQGDNFEGGQGGDTLGLDDFTFPNISTNGVPEKVANDSAFMSEVDRVSSKFEIDPSTLLAVMDFETGGSFDPAQKNAAGSSGTGLIQFMAKTAKGLGTSVEELSKLSRAEQMKWVEKYLDQFGDKIRGGEAADVYMAVLFPKAISKPDDFVLFRKGTKAYQQNRGLDKSGDGTVTKKEAASKVVSLVGKHT